MTVEQGLCWLALLSCECKSPFPGLSRVEVLGGVTIVTGTNWPECQGMCGGRQTCEVFTLNPSLSAPAISEWNNQLLTQGQSEWHLGFGCGG